MKVRFATLATLLFSSVSSTPVLAQSDDDSLLGEIRQRVAQRQAQNASSSQVMSDKERAFREKRELEYQAFKARYFREFAEFKEQYNNQLAAYRNALLRQWGEVDVSTRTRIVDYAEEDVKTVVDFEKQEVIVSVIHDKDEQPDTRKVEKAIDKLKKLDGDDVEPFKRGSGSTTVDVIDHIVPDDKTEDVKRQTKEWVKNADRQTVEPEVDQKDQARESAYFDQQQQRDENQLDVIADEANIADTELQKTKEKLRRANQINRKNAVAKRDAKKNSEDLKNKRITRFKVKLPNKTEQERIARVKPFALVHSEKWNLPIELIIAVIHTESSFNPLAVSNIPAYGLMQIVPQTAGTDVNEYLFKKREPLNKDYLFVAKQNVEAGAAYLHLLNDRYLAKLSDPQSRLYCAIAAYNTGVGNVARAFSQGRQRKMDKALIDKINQLSPQQVYDSLLKQLPYDETRKYLEKVNKRMAHYKSLI